MNINAARNQMIDQQVRAGDVLDTRVLSVLAEVPRELFVPPAYRTLAFADTQIPLSQGQVMMTPQVEGRTLQALDIGSQDRVLEIGTGSGFLAACLARLGRELTTLEFFPELARSAQQNLHATGTRGYDVQVEDVFNWQPSGQYDCIAVTGSLPVWHAPFEDWLLPGGRLFVVVGTAPVMDAVLARRLADGTVTRQSLFETVLPPLINAPQPEKFHF